MSSFLNLHRSRGLCVAHHALRRRPRKNNNNNSNNTIIFSADPPLLSRRFSKGFGLRSRRQGFGLRRVPARIRATGQDFDDFSSVNDWGDNEGIFGGSSYILSSSGEDSDTDIVVNPIGDVDLPRANERFDTSDGGFAVTTYRLSLLRRTHKANRIQEGLMINLGLIGVMTILLLFVDWCSWKIVRLPLPSFHLTRPFCISAVITAFVGYIFIQIFRSLKIYQIMRKEGPYIHSSKRATPTMGGLFFIPIGIVVARCISGSSSVELSGVAAVTMAFAGIGLLDDVFSIVRNHNYGLPAFIKVILEVAAGTLFWFWLDSTNISSPYSMKMLVPLPAPLGIVSLGRFYVYLTTFCFVSMGNGINLTDGLDGLAGGTAALAFIGMSIAVLPICSDISIFGASMAGACVGFLLHNRYKASIFMGDIGSLALGGALAAMAACTGMFFPLFISSGIFVLEALSVIVQVLSIV
ncbi:hypothetical protein Sjap_026440 [Stephania japonica]|uniref:Phospho-N-acetylmuramoyl-pentapeptide-transferase n=1 Tax=Stephania japonica TaxID=461633 RepID=A0AAP0E3R0_9MAGN